LQFTEKVLLEIYLRYNEENELTHIPFEHISELYQSENYKYAIGIISLEKLHQVKSYLQEKGIFIAYTGKKIQSTEEKTQKSTEKQKQLEMV
jgi:homoserine dehydrogenase